MNKKKNISLIQLFSHLEGIAVVPTVNTLFKNGIIDTILTDNEVSLKSLSLNKKAQMGYLNVALNTLASLGTMKKTLNQNDSLYHLTSYGKEYFKLIENYSFYEQIEKELHNFIWLSSIDRKDNASTLTPDHLYSKYYYSHPPAKERIENIKKRLN